jgi:AAA+ ATPase superfamily predicted ATPase
MIKERFFDRKNYLELLEKRIKHLKDGYRQNVAVTGDEMVGKTSVIFKLLNKFCDAKIVIVYLEIKPEDASVFVKRFIGSLLYNFLSGSGIPMREDLDFLITKSRKFIPKTVEKIEYILAACEKKKKTNLFTELLSLSDNIYHETGKSCVVIFDEFQNLESLGPSLPGMVQAFNNSKKYPLHNHKLGEVQMLEYPYQKPLATVR